MGVISGNASEVFAKNLERASALLIGPGFGTEDTTKEFIENLLKRKVCPKKIHSKDWFCSPGKRKEGRDNVAIAADDLRCGWIEIAGEDL